MKKIVFYIRALFGESISPKIENHDIREAVKNFNLYSGITIQEYRQMVHKIQVKCISNITDKIIYNRFDNISNSGWPYTYDVLQNTTVDMLKNIDDDAILIPLDDDDWLSPKIADIDFCKNGLTIWNTISIPQASCSKVFYHNRNEKVPIVTRTDEEFYKLGNLLSNCVAISGNVIKKMIDVGDIRMLERMLQRHTEPRKVIRENRFDEWGLTETVLEDYLAVYVKHAGNVSYIKKLGGPHSSKELFYELVNPYKTINYSGDIFPLNYNWCKNYCDELKKINSCL
jgi:hypothetical protein